MRFGVRKADVVPSEGGNGRYLKYFQKGEKKLRFLEEVDEWTEFYDHYDDSMRRSYPCTRDRDTCPGCTSPSEKTRRASRRFLVNALDPKTGYVDLWKVPTSIMDDFERYAAKDEGTVTKRFYTVIQFKDREGKVKYSVDREETDRTPISEYSSQMGNHEEALQQAYEDVFGELDGEADKVMPKANIREEEVVEESVPFEDDDDQNEEDELIIDPDDLPDMDAGELKTLFRKAGLAVPRTSDASILRKRLLEAIDS